MKAVLSNKIFLEFSLNVASKSETFSNFMYDVLNSRQRYNSLFKRLIMELPKTIKEYIF